MTAIPGHALERIVVVPVNGYANRLQAWASADCLGKELGVPVHVLWEPERVAPAGALDLFDSGVVDRAFLDAGEVSGLLGAPHASLPRYVIAAGASGDVLMLAGHDRGEQALMGELMDALAQGRHRALVIVAGGHFHLPSTQDPEAGRRAFYRAMRWSPAVEERTREALRDLGDGYLGLHVRGTDRARTAPTERQVRAALVRLRDRVGAPSLYIAADSERGRLDWEATASELGLHPHALRGAVLDRGMRDAGIDALADWRVLGASRGLAYSVDSSFGAEAVVASGTASVSVGVRATRPRQLARSLRDLALGPIQARQRSSADPSQASTAAS